MDVLSRFPAPAAAATRPAHRVLAALLLAFGLPAIAVGGEAGRATVNSRPPAPVPEAIGSNQSVPCKPAPHSGGADQTARWARDSYGKNYCAHYVGGGNAFSIGSGRFQSESRQCDEGTFGMDYNPCWSRVGLLWTHGRRHQSGQGQYESDKKNSGFPNWLR